MKTPSPRYPVDRYLVDSSKTMDMVKLMDDDLWKPEPALKPEDEIMLRKLHGMLQSTADDLRILSGELSKYHEPGVQVKTLPTPLDEDFNEKVHIEEIVNAKFHGHKIVNPDQFTSTQQKIPNVQEIIANEIKKISGIRTVIPPKQVQKKPIKKLSFSRTKIIEISENKKETIDCKNTTKSRSSPIISRNKDERTHYNEIVHENDEPKKGPLLTKALNVQKMPSVNIRSELKTQNVLHLDILPDRNDFVNVSENKKNVSVISVLHELPSTSGKEIHEVRVPLEQIPTRKVSKMANYDSSESYNVNSKEEKRTVLKRNSPNKKLDRHKDSNMLTNDHKSKIDVKKTRTNINDWKRKLNSIYGQSVKPNKSNSKSINTLPKSKNSQVPVWPSKEKAKNLNNTEYIPYTKLTLGGVKVKDLEKELTLVPYKNDAPLSPILDKILSRQNSFSCDKSHQRDDGEKKILTTSDENLLQEVLDIEEKVSSVLSKNFNKNSNQTPTISNKLSENEDDNTYADDFEIDNSEPPSEKSKSTPRSASEVSANSNIKSTNNTTTQPGSLKHNEHNKTYVKVTNLSFKNKIDTFEFIHTIDRQDCATQSASVNKISLKETQTSPRNENEKIQTIRNDLSDIDPKHEVENMFKLEKDFIKKLIINEYSDLIEKNLNKPSTSNISQADPGERNISSIQKNTQTSPARVKNVMTSPTRTKTRSTSPFALSLTLNKQTSPMIIVTNEEKVPENEITPVESKVSINHEEHNITINLSSPRFSLRLPQSSGDLSNSDRHHTNRKIVKHKTFRVSSSSSSREDYSSSDISFGEINREFKRKLRRHKIPSISEPSSSSLSKYSERSSIVAPMKSEGEISVCQTKSNKYSKSEGEISLGQAKYS